MTTRRVFLLFLILFLLLAPSSIFSDPDPGSNPRQKPLIFVGHDEFAPYSFYSDGSPSGFSVDLIKVISATINRDITIKLLPWEECLAQIKAGTVDGMIGIPIYKTREAYLDFSTPVTTIDYAIFVESSNIYVHSLKTLEGTVVGAHKGALMVDTLRKDKRIKVIETKSIAAAIKKLQDREITAIIEEKDVVLYYLQKEKVSDIKMVGPPLRPVFEYGLAVKKGEDKLLRDIDHAIKTLEENGTLQELRRKWLGLYFAEPFPWKMVSMVIGGIMGILLLLMGSLWMISLNVAVKTKTRQIQVMSQKIVEKDKLAVLGKLAGQIAHELRTPLSIINNSVYLLRKEAFSDKELFEKRLRMMEDKVKLTSNILESILGYSRVKAEMATEISVRDCIETVLSDMEVPEGIELTVTYKDDENLFIYIDFHQLYSVLRNLVLNALQAMGTEGKLDIRAFSSGVGKMVNVRVSDTGRGILGIPQDQIFSLFSTTKITGTGLGLPISKSIAENNGGDLYLESSDEHGSCFTLKLPSSKSQKK